MKRPVRLGSLPSILAFLALALALGNARADEDASDPVRIVDATTLELTDGAMPT